MALSRTSGSADELGLERTLSQLSLDQEEAALGRTTTVLALAESAERGDDSALLLDADGGEHRLLLGRTDSAVYASLALHHANAITILDDTEAGAALPTPVAPAALHEFCAIPEPRGAPRAGAGGAGGVGRAGAGGAAAAGGRRG